MRRISVSEKNHLKKHISRLKIWKETRQIALTKLGMVTPWYGDHLLNCTIYSFVRSQNAVRDFRRVSHLCFAMQVAKCTFFSLRK